MIRKIGNKSINKKTEGLMFCEITFLGVSDYNAIELTYDFLQSNYVIYVIIKYYSELIFHAHS